MESLVLDQAYGETNEVNDSMSKLPICVSFAKDQLSKCSHRQRVAASLSSYCTPGHQLIQQ